MTTQMTDARRTGQRTMKVAVAGLGAAAGQILVAAKTVPEIDVVAGADIQPAALEAFQQRFGGRVYDSLEQLCEDPEVEAIWISTPNHMHCENAITAARAGKHVIIEKPMAITLEEGERMVEAADKYKVHLLCGHTTSLLSALPAMRQFIASGELGRICAVNVWAYTDWMFRSRTPPEVDIKTGGGVLFRQGPHQVDTVRKLCGGLVRSVRAQVGEWFSGRRAPGYYAAFLEFEDGTPATIVHNGYGYFSHFEMVPWAASPPQFPGAAAARRKALRLNPDLPNEAQEKGARRLGGGQSVQPNRTGFQNDLGVVIASCELGDVRQSPKGLWIYDDNGQRELDVELQEDCALEWRWMYDAVVNGRPIPHDGHWGLATLEVVMAMLQSARERREIRLSRQVPARD